MARLFDYAALSNGQAAISPMMDSTRRHRQEGSDVPLNYFPQNIMPASNDSAGMDMQVHPDSLDVPDELDWSNDELDIFPEIMNDLTFLGQRWSTYLPEEATY